MAAAAARRCRCWSAGRTSQRRAASHAWCTSVEHHGQHESSSSAAAGADAGVAGGADARGEAIAYGLYGADARRRHVIAVEPRIGCHVTPTASQRPQRRRAGSPHLPRNTHAPTPPNFDPQDTCLALPVRCPPRAAEALPQQCAASRARGAARRAQQERCRSRPPHAHPSTSLAQMRRRRSSRVGCANGRSRAAAGAHWAAAAVVSPSLRAILKS